MKNNDMFAITAFLTILAAVLAALLFFVPSRGAVVPPDCAIPEGGGTCTVTVSLPANKTANYAAYDFTFVPTAGTPTQWTSLSPVAGINNEDSVPDSINDRKWAYLYAYPSYVLPYRLEIEATGSASVNIYANLMILRPVRPRAATSFEPICLYNDVGQLPRTTCDSANSWVRQCRIGYCTQTWFYFQHTDNTPSVTILAEADLVRDPQGTVNGTQTLAASISYPDIREPLSTEQFVVQIHAQGTTQVIQKPPEVRVRSVPLLYPGTVTYAVGQTSNTFSGPYDAPKRSTDLSAGLNNVCRRPANAEACTANLTLSSPAGGAFYVTETIQLVNMTPTPGCTSTWTCSNWTQCANQTQTRICTDSSSCNPPTTPSPSLTQTCSVSDPCGTCAETANATCNACIVVPCLLEWRCTEWAACADGQQTRTCTNPCLNTRRPKPPEAQTCTQPPVTPKPWWQSWYTLVGAAVSILGGTVWLWRRR